MGNYGYKNFCDSLEESLDSYNHFGKVIPYYYGVPYKNKIVLVPLCSKCPRSYSLPIYNTGNRVRPGLVFCKMIIMDRNISSESVNGNVIHDLQKKYSQIVFMVQRTIKDYKMMKYKVENSM